MLAGAPPSEAEIAKRITDALAEEAGARRKGIVVTFSERSQECYASGDELMIDQAPPK